MSLWGSIRPTRVTWMTNILCLLSDIRVMNVKRWWRWWWISSWMHYGFLMFKLSTVTNHQSVTWSKLSWFIHSEIKHKILTKATSVFISMTWSWAITFSPSKILPEYENKFFKWNLRYFDWSANRKLYFFDHQITVTIEIYLLLAHHPSHPRRRKISDGVCTLPAI